MPKAVTPAKKPTATNKAVVANGTERTVDMPALIMRAEARPETFNEAERTVDVVISTGAAVLRYSWARGENYYEELSIDASHVRMDRLTSGNAPVLNSHNGYDLAGVIGVVTDARIEGGQIVGTLKFSTRDDVAPIMQDIKEVVNETLS